MFFDFFNKKPAVCAYSHQLPSKFKYVIDPFSVNGRKNGSKKFLCKEHFIADWIKFIESTIEKVVFTEPIDKNDAVKKHSQSVFYTSEELKIDNFSEQDEEDVKELLSKATSEKPIVWLPKEAAYEITDSPLIKEKDIYESITVEELKKRLQRVFAHYDSQEKGEFQTNLPSGAKEGIFLYTNYL